MKIIVFFFFHLIFFISGLIVLPFGFIIFLDAVSNNCCTGPFLSTVLLVGTLSFMIVGGLLGWLISFILAARMLKIKEAELRKAIQWIDKNGNADTKLYNWHINFAYRKST